MGNDTGRSSSSSSSSTSSNGSSVQQPIPFIANEMVLHIFTHLDIQDILFRVNRVCKAWYLLTHSNTLWKRFYLQHWIPHDREEALDQTLKLQQLSLLPMISPDLPTPTITKSEVIDTRNSNSNNNNNNNNNNATIASPEERRDGSGSSGSGSGSSSSSGGHGEESSPTVSWSELFREDYLQDKYWGNSSEYGITKPRESHSDVINCVLPRLRIDRIFSASDDSTIRVSITFRNLSIYPSIYQSIYLSTYRYLS